jgi:hypothetical protein
MNKLKAFYYEKSKVLELWENEKMLFNTIVDQVDNWFGHTYKGKQYDFNFYGRTLGMFECEEIEENEFQAGDFITNIEVEVV